MLFNARPIAEMRPRPFKAVRRLSLDSLTEADIESLLTGNEPLIVEGLDKSWPPEFRDAPLRDIAQLAHDPSSVHIDEQQRFDIKPDKFFDLLEAGKNVRIFGCVLTPERSRIFSLPDKLQSRLTLFRYDEARPLGFIGGGGAITMMHHDFELNANWHFVLGGTRQIYLWTYEQSPNLFKLPFIGLSMIQFMKGLLDCRFSEGYACTLNRGELIYMPPGCWHQVEYPEPSMALTYAFHRTKREHFVGTITGHFWQGLMTFWQAVEARRLTAIGLVPLMLPLLLFAGIYVPLTFVAKIVLRRASALINGPCRVVESALFLLYFPLFNRIRKKMWVGY
jgi:hypothetical protein